MSELTKKQETSVFATPDAFDQAQRVAKMLSNSSLVPVEYRNNISNTLIALEMSHRTGSSPIMVMQNMNVINGRPSWSSSFIIAALNSCGRFEPLEFVYEGNEGNDNWSCYVVTKNKRTGKNMKGPKISIAMAKAERWYSKKDKHGNETSKWQTMPELMLSYRAAAFFGRLHAPDILQGMHTDDEHIDITTHVVDEKPPVVASAEKTTPQHVDDAQIVDDDDEIL